MYSKDNRNFLDNAKTFILENKPLTICISVILALVILAGTVWAVTYRPVKDISEETQFESLPTNSRDYSVEEAPVSKVDKDDSSDKKSGTFKDMNGRKINREGNSTDPKMTQIPNIGKRFKIPSAGLDVPLGKVNEVNNLIRPTNYTSVFYVANRGVPYNKTNKGTTYIVTHALDDGGVAPGNFLIDSNTKKVRVSKGTEIYTGDKKFKVTDSFRAGKSLIAKNNKIWDASIKGRMVIITCFPNSNDNQVIIAQRAWKE